jgi:hypothetical protein
VINVAKISIVSPHLTVKILDILRYPLSDSFPEIISHKTIIDIYKRKAIFSCKKPVSAQLGAMRVYPLFGLAATDQDFARVRAEA